MLKLRTILLYNNLYYIIIVIVLIISSIRINIPYKSIYDEGEYELYGFIDNYSIDGNELKIYLKTKENIIGTYYFKTPKEKNDFSLELGDYIYLLVELHLPKENTNNNLFNYKKYLIHNNIYYIGNISKYKLLTKNKNIYYYLKQRIQYHLGNDPYLNTFLIGNKEFLDSRVINSYQYNGISHLFAISGMHVGILTGIILFILKRLNIKERKRFIILNILLIIYLLLIDSSPSVIRAVLFFILFSINKEFYFYIKPTNLCIIALSICFLINPNYIFNVGFLYSFVISYSLILLSDYINKNNNYLIKLLKVSVIAFISSFPITIYNFNSINYLSIIYNLFFVPFISVIVFPFSLLTFLIPNLINIFHILTNILEKISLLLSNINSQIVFPKINIMFYIIYYFLLIIIYKFKYRFTILMLIITLYYHYSYMKNKTFINVLDVGQGDSALIYSNNKTALIDTGGIINRKTNWQKKQKEMPIATSIIIPTLKSLGINSINSLVISHGDYDHMGEAINLVKNFKVEKVIFNCGPYNDLEKELIEVLDKKKIKYYSCIKELNIDNNKLYFLQTDLYDNENDNSNVIYTEIDGYKFMFMGDAGIDKEKDILEKYNISDIDVLKVGHHGSKTSSSENFINEMNPKYSVISVGKNNRYGHPNKEVLNVLEDSKIYRTDQDGSIMFKIKNNKLQIETCSP